MVHSYSSYDLRLLISLLLVAALGASQYSGAKADDIPPVFFVFGDSTFDVGTNNGLQSGAKSNFEYYGIDFAYSKPTGRFSNGFNTADQIVRLFGCKTSPPSYLRLVQDQSSLKANILHGVNFASAGAGIFNDTGKLTYGEVVWMAKQVEQFQSVQGNITATLGPETAASFLSKAMFLISVGSNDIFDYFRYNRTTVTQQQLMASLSSTYYSHLKNLFILGARKFAIVGVPPLGCCPYAMISNLTDTGTPAGCVTIVNDFAEAFQPVVASVLATLRSEANGTMLYSLGDTFQMTSIMLEDPLGYGFTNTVDACCGNGTLNAEKPCIKQQNPNLCPVRREYLFWDMFHPTERAAGLVAGALYGGTPPLVTPMNMSQLARM